MMILLYFIKVKKLELKFNRTHDEIRFETEKPPEITGIPRVGHDEMRLKLETSSETIYLQV